MTRSERALYLIGIAVLEQQVFGARDPDTLRAMTEVVNWVEYWLSQEDLDFLEAMGLIFNVDHDDEMQLTAAMRNRDSNPPSDEDDGISF